MQLRVLVLFLSGTRNSTYDISVRTLPVRAALFMISNVAIWTVFNAEYRPCFTHDAPTTLFTYFRITGADHKFHGITLLQFSRIRDLVIDRRNVNNHRAIERPRVDVRSAIVSHHVSFLTRDRVFGITLCR